MGKIPQARAELQQALELARAAGNESQQFLSLLQFSSIFYAERDYAQANKFAGEAVAAAHARQYAARATKALAGLEQQWGKDAFRGYLSRPDIQFYRKQLNELAKDGS